MIKFNLNPNEKIVLIVGKHWIAMMKPLFGLIISIFLPLVLFVLIPILFSQFPNWQTENLIYLATFVYTILLLISWIAFFFSWTTYHLDIWVVTTHRIFIVEQINMFNREISSLTLDKVQDLTIDIDGFLPTVLKYGEILVETAGEHKNFVFKNAKNPELMKVTINTIQKDFYNRPMPVAFVPEQKGPEV